MKRILVIGLLLSQVFLCQAIVAQEVKSDSTKIEEFNRKKEQIIQKEKEALKQEVIAINSRYNKGEITLDEATKLKKEAADIHALNIENKIAILDNSIALVARGGIHIKTEDTEVTISTDPQLSIHILDDEESVIDIDFGRQKKYDKRTRSNLLVAFGFNNAIIEGQSFDDSPYKVGKSKFFEMGWTWSTRVLENSNAIRFRYGFSFQFNGLNPTDNQYFVQDGE